MASTRGLMKQELRRALGNIEWAINHIARVTQTYLEVHPEIAYPLIEVLEALDKIAEAVKEIEENI